jgi:hypothetical protein
MSAKMLKYLIYLAGAICLLVFLSIRFLPMYNFFLVEDRNPEYFEFTKYGELYYFSHIKHFKEEIPIAEYKFRHSENQANINEAEIITFGDSYFEFSRQKSLPERLQEVTHKKVHSIYAFYPLNYLDKIHYTQNIPKTFIFEIAERMIPVHFARQHKTSANVENGHITEKLKSLVFPENREELYNGMLKGSYLTHPFYASIATIKFNEFGYISSQTPIYKTGEKPWLFYHESVNDQNTSFYYQHSQKEIESYCNHIEDLFIQLKEKYNFDIIFCPVPNKYTVYHKLINEKDEYNNFLPQIYREMEKRGIDYVDLYNPFIAADTLLYYGTDTHWNAKGVDIALKEIINKLNKHE